MQSLEIISVNLWHILISLCNLLVLFLIIKKFLFKPVKKMMAERKNEIDRQYALAEEAERKALQDRDAWESKLAGVQDEADEMMKQAAAQAKRRKDEILSDARGEADGILRQAKSDAELEMKKAEDTIRREIIGGSSALTENILEREIDEKDHKDLIDSFLDGLGDENDGDQ